LFHPFGTGEELPTDPNGPENYAQPRGRLEATGSIAGENCWRQLTRSNLSLIHQTSCNLS
jgi:hypothetical protein